MSLEVNNVFKAYGTFKADKPAAAGRNSRANEKSDSAEITSKAKDFGALMQAVSDAPDLRSDKVADIKMRVELGRYNVSSNAVASKLLGEYYKAQQVRTED